MSDRLLIGNLSLQTTESSLKELFSGAGRVQSVELITDQSGKKKGFAFVDMASTVEAQKAIDLLNGADCDGRAITVNSSEPVQQAGLSFIAKCMRLLQK